MQRTFWMTCSCVYAESHRMVSSAVYYAVVVRILSAVAYALVEIFLEKVEYLLEAYLGSTLLLRISGACLPA